MNKVLKGKTKFFDKVKKKFLNLVNNPIRLIIYGLLGSIVLLPLTLSFPIENTLVLKEVIESLQNWLDFHITIFIGAFSFLAIVFAIIQLKKGHDEVLSELFEETYVFQFFGFTASSIIVLVVSQLFFKDITIKYRISIFSQITLIVEVIGLCIMLYRIYSILTTDFFIDKLLERIDKVYLHKNRIISKQKSERLVRRYFEKYYQSILDQDTEYINRFTSIVNKLLKINDLSSITIQLEWQFALFLENSLNSNNENSIRNIFRILIFLLLNFVENQDKRNSKRISNLITKLYQKLENRGSQNNLIVQDITQRFNEFIQVKSNNLILISNKNEDFDKFNNITECILYFLNTIMKILIEHKNFVIYKAFFDLFIFLKFHYSSCVNKYSVDKSKQILQLESTFNPNQGINEYNIVEKYELTRRRLKFCHKGQMSWALDLYFNNHITNDEFDRFSIFFITMVESLFHIIEEILFLSHLKSIHSTFGMDDWNKYSFENIINEFPLERYLPEWYIKYAVIRILKLNLLEQFENGTLYYYKDFYTKFDSYYNKDGKLNLSVQMDTDVKLSIKILKENNLEKVQELLDISKIELERRIIKVEEFFEKLKSIVE